jgi:tetratricopeptide (TPR) repeat protein
MSTAPASCIAALALAAVLSACTPQAALIASLVPQGTVSVLLGNLEQLDDTNRKRVVELERGGRWDELASFAESELRKNRSNADWWLIAGYARSQLSQHARAADAYSQVVRLEPDNPAGWHLLAQSHRAAGEPRRAVNALESARLALRDSPLTSYLLGESYSDLRRYQEAAAAYREALKIEQRFPAAWYALAMSYTRLNRTDEARDAQSRLEKLDPQLAGRLREAMAAETARVK